jgi:hypothetical protein
MLCFLVSWPFQTAGPLRSSLPSRHEPRPDQSDSLWTRRDREGSGHSVLPLRPLGHRGQLRNSRQQVKIRKQILVNSILFYFVCR